MRQVSLISQNISQSTRQKPTQLGWALLTVMLILTPVTAQAQTTAQQGYRLLERGWVNDAIREFQQALRSSPQSLDAKLGLAIAYQRAGQDAAAWSAYQQVIAQDPQNATALMATGMLAAYRPEWQQLGIDALTALLKLQPQNHSAQAQRALLYGYQGRFAEAIADYEQVLPTNSSSDVVLQAAQIYTFSGDQVTGLTLFKQYLESKKSIPNNVITAYALALQSGDQAEQQSAIKILTERLQTLPASDALTAELRSTLAKLYSANQQTQEALAALEPLQNQPNARLALARGLSAIGQQTQDQQIQRQAIQSYQQVLQQSHLSPGLLTEAADALSQQVETRAEALQLYQQVLATSPNLGLKLKSAWLSYQLGQLSRSELRQTLQQLTQPLPDSPAEQQQLAQALVQINPPDPRLLSVYQSLRSTHLPFLHIRIAQIELQQGDLAAARQALSAYQQAQPDDATTELLLAEIERQSGNLAASSQRYQQIAARYPNRPIGKDALRGLAGLQLAQGQLQEASAIYQQLQAAYPNDQAMQLGSTAIAYRQQQISEAEAAAALETWLKANPNQVRFDAPPELFLLAGSLPPDPAREPLYSQLLELEPNNMDINRRWVQVWAERNPERAQSRVEQLLADYPNQPEVYFVQGEFAQATGNLDLASQSYETILAKQPHQLDAIAALAGVRFQQRRYQEAQNLYQQVLAQKPDDPEIRRVLIDLNRAQDQPVAAWQQLRQLERSNPTNPQIERQMHQLQTDLLRRRGFQPSWERY